MGLILKTYGIVPDRGGNSHPCSITTAPLKIVVPPKSVKADFGELAPQVN
ncbi:MAG: hypothetical protein O2955_03255 [Planctomycetota bacterium]|nr:hypothetical protein [Planctomycetota bacterium]MDA1211506.1 hypothetical protein [Planctomycetota bacterium]